MPIQIIRPRIFEPYPNLVVGYTAKNINLGENLELGLDFKISHEKEFESSLKFFANELKISCDKIIFNSQFHSNIIRTVDSNSEQNLKADGMITNSKGILLTAKSADCGVVILYNPKKQTLGCYHSGRIGTINNITQTCLESLSKLDSKPSETLAYISPTICQAHYPVLKNHCDQIPSKFRESENTQKGKLFMKRLNQDIINENKDEVFFVNFAEAIKEQLINAGIPKENVELSNQCTFEVQELHSYRRDKPNNGLGIGFVGIF